MSIKNLTLPQAREKLGVKQTELGQVFEQALVTGDSGQKQYDFSKVTCLGADVSGSIAVAEKVKAMNAELDELAVHAETLEAAEKAAAAHAERGKAVSRPPFGGGSQRDFGQQGQHMKSLGERIAEQKAYQDWAKGGAGGGITLSFDDMLPSDMMAKGAQFDTMGRKALMSTAAGFAPEVTRMPGFVEAATRPIELLDIIPVFRTGEAAVKYMEETTRTHAAAEKAEGADFAESEFAFTERNSPVQKITDSLPVTDEQLEDVAFMESYINSRLSFGIRQRLDRQCWIGDGSTPNLRGLLNVAGIQTQAKGVDPAMDAFYKAMTKIRLTGRAVPTHHVMHPTNWESIRLTRTNDGIYIFGSPTEAGPERLWGLPVVQNSAGSAGTGMVGSFQPSWVYLAERRGVDIQVGYTGTQFLAGKRTVRGDMRAAFVVQRPAAFTQVTGL